MLENIILGLSNAAMPGNLLVAFLGTLAGIVIGAMPGLSATMGVVLLLPMTYSMDISSGIILLMGVYTGAMFGGSISAILINTPGTPAAAATLLDGHPYAKRGEGGRAIGIACVSSAIGGIVSAVVLCICAPSLAKVALKFSAPEYFALALFGLAIIGSISGKSIWKGLLSGSIGILLATVGMDNMSGVLRYTFGTTELMGGLALIPALIGLFAMPQVIENLRQGDAKLHMEQSSKNLVPTKSDMKKITPVSVFGGLLGTVIGAIPGTGAAISCFVAYNETKRFSKHPEKFGTGIPEGVAASESANSGTTGGTLIPLLTLGVPGDVTTAVLLGAFMVQGLTPGPMLFNNNPEIMYTIFVGLFIINFFVLGLGLTCSGIFTKMVSLPNYILTPAIFILCVIGSYAINNVVFDVFVMFLFGIVGYIFEKLEIPTAPLIIGIILGPMAESNFRRALIMSKGSYSIFVSTPISIFFLALTALSILAPVISAQIKKKKVTKER